MSELNNSNSNPQFLSLIVMLATACWQQMGKVPNPVNGKVEKELNHAKMTLELLITLRDKTKGNLTAEEDKVMSNTVSDLQLNFADEIEKDQKQQPKN